MFGKILEFLRRLQYVVYGIKYLVICLLVFVPHDSFHKEKVVDDSGVIVDDVTHLTHCQASSLRKCGRVEGY